MAAQLVADCVAHNTDIYQRDDVGVPLADCIENMWSKNFDERPHIARHAVIENSIVFFVAYTAAEIPNPLQWARQPPKIAPSRGGESQPHLIMELFLCRSNVESADLSTSARYVGCRPPAALSEHIGSFLWSPESDDTVITGPEAPHT